MKIKFMGAAREVTGSCFLLTYNGRKFLVDCGMRQGPAIFEKQTLDFDPTSIDSVILTHAHIDHSGLLPLLYKYGFRGVIYATSATSALANIMLRDAGHIQETEAMWKRKKLERRGETAEEPLYTVKDAENVLKLFVSKEYGERFGITAGLTATFLDAGHILGSSHILIEYGEGAETKKVLFSGDIGNLNRPMLNDPSPVPYADYVVTESTYGDRDHEDSADPAAEKLALIIQNTFDRNGKVVIPCFAVGRTQEILFYLREIKKRGLVTGHGNFRVYLDSPLAIEATNIFQNIDKRYYDLETHALLANGENPVGFPGLKLSVTADDSKMINDDDSPAVIISASGMCEAGRIRHHLKYNLWKKENTILFVGYQVEGTLGAEILGGAKSVKLLGEEVTVAAEVRTLSNSSAHADRMGLINWLGSLKKAPETVFTVHGNDRSCEMLAEKIRGTYGWKAVSPFYGEEYDLDSGEMVSGAIRRTERKKKNGGRLLPYDLLRSALGKLAGTVDDSKGRANRDIQKFTEQIESLVKQWER